MLAEWRKQIRLGSERKYVETVTSFSYPTFDHSLTLVVHTRSTLKEVSSVKKKDAKRARNGIVIVTRRLNKRKRFANICFCVEQTRSFYGLTLMVLSGSIKFELN